MNDTLDKYAVKICICKEGMYDGDKLSLGTWKDIWEHLKNLLMNHQRKERKTTDMGIKMQSEIHKRLKEPSQQWMKCNINPPKASSIINMQEQVIET